MFFINFGSAPIEYDSKRPKDIICHNCHQKGQTFIYKYLKYFYILYIPIFTYKFWTKYKCVRCNFEANEKDLSQKNQLLYENFKTKKLLPIWTFSGLIIISACVFYNVLF